MEPADDSVRLKAEENILSDFEIQLACAVTIWALPMTVDLTEKKHIL